MPDWVIWLVAAAALAAGEVFTLGFFLGPLALAAGLAAIPAALGGGPLVQFAVFILASIASLAVFRPIARRHMRTPAQLRTGTAAVIGERAQVIERVDACGGSAQLRGEVWSARAFDEDQVLEPGQRVEVMQIDGATALVAE